nr:F-box protein At1g10780 [Ipomoea batatas]
MDSLPDAIVYYILSHISNAKDVAYCSCVSKRWKETMPTVRSLFFPRNLFDNFKDGNPDAVIGKMISSVERLEGLCIYCSFSGVSLASWLSLVGPSLKSLELRMDNLSELQSDTGSPSKLDSIRAACNLESLKLWGVLMKHSPKWDTFHRLKNLEIVGARVDDMALSATLKHCPNIRQLLLLGCEGLRSVIIELPQLALCKLDFYGAGNCSLSVNCPKLENLEIQGCSWIKVRETQFLRNLSISNSSGTGRVYMLDFGKLVALETLAMRGIQWSWDAISKLLQMASEVKQLFMKVEFTGDFEALLPFPEVDFADFFNSHPKLQTFDIHGAMFAALCQKNSLKNLDSSFAIPCLEKVVVTVRSPLNAEQKMSTLESLLRYAKNLRNMKIKILQMKSCHSSSDEFFEDICRFSRMNRKIVSIE